MGITSIYPASGNGGTAADARCSSYRRGALNNRSPLNRGSPARTAPECTLRGWFQLLAAGICLMPIGAMCLGGLPSWWNCYISTFSCTGRRFRGSSTRVDFAFCLAVSQRCWNNFSSTFCPLANSLGSRHAQSIVFLEILESDERHGQVRTAGNNYGWLTQCIDKPKAKNDPRHAEDAEGFVSNPTPLSCVLASSFYQKAVQPSDLVRRTAGLGGFRFHGFHHFHGLHGSTIMRVHLKKSCLSCPRVYDVVYGM